jgi:prepilin-type N-terminal cleavage/methylation domain-containing protein
LRVRYRTERKRLGSRRLRAFTLVEVLLALSIVVIGLVPLLHLLVKSISIMDSAQCLSQATLIGSAKLAEAVSTGCTEIGTDNGHVENEGNDLVFEWKVSVADEPSRELEEMNLSGLRRVNVTVMWNEGTRQRQITLSTYVTLDQTVIQATPEQQGTPQQ